MPRRKRVIKRRDVGADPRYKSLVVQKFINTIMERGKKNTARSIVYEALGVIATRIKGDDRKALDFFEKAIANLKPYVEVKSRRVGGGVYQVPIEVRVERAQALAFRWLREAADARSDKTMGKRIASELFDLMDGKGNALKKRIDVHRMAEANRAFSHYAW